MENRGLRAFERVAAVLEFCLLYFQPCRKCRRDSRTGRRGFQLIIGDAPILNGQFIGNELAP